MTRRAAVARKQATTRKPRSLKIKKGDHVIVIAGKDSGREGTVILADPKRQRVLVQGVNMIKKNTKVDYQGRRGAKEGGIVHQEALIHVSNVQLIDPETKKPARAGYRLDEDKRKVRISRPGGKDI
jgi:large subunit ribosomal protein L24